MAFLKGVKKAIEIPVEIDIPVLNEKDEPCKLEIRPIVTYKRFKRSESRKVQAEVAKISQEAAKAFEDGDISALFGDRLKYFDDLLRDSIVDWRKMPGPDDEDVPFSVDVLDEALEEDHYYAGLMIGLRHALGWGKDGVTGSEDVETKN